MSKCADCYHYCPLKSGEPPVGWCEFTSNTSLPFWLDIRRNLVDRLGADVAATDGEECLAFTSSEPH